MLKVDNARKGFFEPDQFAAVLTQLPDYLKALARVAYVTGWRPRSELLTRQWRDVDFKSGWLRLEPGETKNREGRMFPLDTFDLRAVLEAQRTRVSAIEKGTGAIIPHVFTYDDGRRIGTYDKAWQAACRRASVAGRLMYDFRRTAVRNLERAGIPRSVAMKLTGHKTESVYRRYAIVSESDLRDAGARLTTFHAGDRAEAAPPKVVALKM